MINIHFSQGQIQAEPISELKIGFFGFYRNVLSSGKKHHRITFDDKPGDQALAIRTLSKTILDDRPGFDLLNWLGIRRRVILQVQNGDTKGYIEVNAESLRKRLGIATAEFYRKVKEGNEDITAYVQTSLSHYQKPQLLQHLSVKSFSQIIGDGINLLYGKNGIKKDEAEAFALFRKAAVEGGSAWGYGNMAYCYSHGKGVDQSSDAAKQALQDMIDSIRHEPRALIKDYLKKYAELGVKEVEFFIDKYSDLELGGEKASLNFELGKACLNNVVDAKKAFELFQKAKTAGDIESHMYIAHCYSKGLGVDQPDSPQAKETIKMMIQRCKNKFSLDRDLDSKLGRFLIKCEELGIPEFEDICNEDPQLYVLMGKELRYSFGANADKDTKKGFEFFQKAAERGNLEGYSWVAHCYHKGYGVEQSFRRATEKLAEGNKLIKTEDDAKDLLRAINIY